MTDRQLLDRYMLARLMYWRNAIMELENSAVNDVVATLNAVKKEISDLIADNAGIFADITEWDPERMWALDAFCDEVLAGAKAATTGAINEASFAAAAASLQNYNAMVNLEGLAVSVSTVAMSAEQMKSFFQTTPLGGRLLGEWVDRAFNKGVKQSILQSLRKSQVMGQGTSNMVKRLLQNAIDDGFALTKREAITLARTYTQTANVEAQMAVYKKNEDLIYAYKWISILDANVCPRCGALDGKVYKKDEKRPPMPLHPRCRCLWQALMRIEELGISSEDLEQVARPWVRRELKNIDEGGKRKIIEGGKTTEDFGEWWKTLPAREQEFSVGKRRAELLRSGKVKWKDLVDPATGRLYSLEELGFGRGGKPQVLGLLPPSNQRFIEDITGATGEVPFGIKNNAKAVNPDYLLGKEYQRNCQRCLLAYETRRLGHNIEAQGNPYPDRSGTSKRAFLSGWEAFKNPQVYGTLSPDPKNNEFISEKELLKRIKAMDDEARVAIICPLSKNQSHAIVCEKLANQLSFIDPQKGDVGRHVLPKVLKKSGYTYFRMDDLELDENFEWDEVIRKAR